MTYSELTTSLVAIMGPAAGYTPRQSEAAGAVHWGLTTSRLGQGAEAMLGGLDRDGLDRLIDTLASVDGAAMDQMVRILNGQPF